METQKDIKRIYVWTPPRSRSTAFLRAFEQRIDTTVVHEAFQKAYYKLDGATYEQAFEKILADAPTQFFMTKELSYYLTPENPGMTIERMKQFQHIFLLRSPKASLESFYRVTQSKEEGNYFDGNEAGYKELLENYKWIKENVEPNPLVI